MLNYILLSISFKELAEKSYLISKRHFIMAKSIRFFFQPDSMYLGYILGMYINIAIENRL